MKLILPTKTWKKALYVASLAVNDSRNTAFFKVSPDKVEIFSTDGDMKSFIVIAGDYQEEGCFVVDPKRLLSVINSSDKDSVMISYEEEKKTLRIHVSDNLKTFIALGTEDPKLYPLFTEDLEGLNRVTTLNSCTLSGALQFTKGFLPKDISNKKFGSIFIEKGSFTVSNGWNKIGFFKCDNTKELEGLSFKLTTVQPILNFLSKTTEGEESIEILDSPRVTWVSVGEGGFLLGFTKSVFEPPKIPIPSVPEPTCYFTLNRTDLIKKLSRFILSTKDGMVGVSFGVIKEQNLLSMSTILDRASEDTIEYRDAAGVGDDFEFILEGKQLKDLLSTFVSPYLELHLKTSFVYLVSNAEYVIPVKDEEVRMPFTATGVLTISHRSGIK